MPGARHLGSAEFAQAPTLEWSDDNVILYPVRRLLTAFLLVVLVMTESSALAQQVCRHASAEAHAIARNSHDRKTAAAAIAEETAAAAAAKRAALLDAGSFAWAADMLPPLALAPPSQVAEPIRRSLADASAPPGRSVRPLLQPPSA